MHYTLQCVVCHKVAEQEPAYKCPSCGGILQTDYGLKAGDYMLSREPGIFRYSRFLPTTQAHQLTLGEGNVPLLRARILSERLGMQALSFKLEGCNPTASFKDRALAVLVTKALEWDIDTMIIASSGNAGASAAAYAARSGLRLVALVPEATPPNKMMQAALHGAVIVKVPGGYSNSYALCREMTLRHNLFDVTTTFINPYARDGYKTIGYELFEDLGGVPDWIIIPVGAGPILAAVWQAFLELRRMGVTTRLPRLACVQAANCGPISTAFIQGKAVVKACLDAAPTIASGINDPLVGYTDDGDFTLACIRESGGAAVLLDEGEIARSVGMLAQEGICAEPAGSVGAMGLRKLLEAGTIGRQDSVVVLVTGHGLKNPLAGQCEEIPVLSSADLLSNYLFEKGEDRCL